MVQGYGPQLVYLPPTPSRGHLEVTGLCYCKLSGHRQVFPWLGGHVTVVIAPVVCWPAG